MCRTLDVIVVAVFAHSLATVTTSFRLYERHRKCQIWWDDYCVIIALLADIVFAFSFPLGSGHGRSWSITRLLVANTFSVISVWTARISIGLTMTRIYLPGSRSRRSLYAMNVLLAALGIGCLAGLLVPIISCSKAICPIGPKLAAAIVLVLEVIADAILIGIPIYMFWDVKLPRKQRRMIISIFTANAISSAASVALEVVIKTTDYNTQPVWACVIALLLHLKSSVTVMVCNLLVNVTWIYRLFWRREGDDEVTETEETRDKPSSTSQGIFTDLGSAPTSGTFPSTWTDISDRTFTLRGLGSDPCSSSRDTDSRALPDVQSD